MVDLFDLQIFADGAAGATAPAAGGSDGGAALPDQQAQSADTGSVAGSSQTPRMDAQPEADTQNAATETTAQRISFRELIDGDYKEDAQNWVQSVIKDRFKAQDAKNTHIDPIIQALATQYGVDDGDFEGLNNAFMNDPNRYQQIALEQGLSPKQAQELAEIRRQKNIQEKQQAEAQREAATQAHFQQLQQQESEMQQLYPGFDLQRELTDPMFFKLTSQDVGLTLKQAWQAMHGDEIAAAGMQYALERGQAKVAASVQANMNRPSEGGIRRVPATGVKLDPRKMTDAERADLKRRVNAGEKVYL